MTKHQDNGVLGESVFLNPAYHEDNWNKEYCSSRYASGVAYRVHALVSVAWMAHENEICTLPLQQRGIGDTLETARAMLSDLIREVQRLEEKLNRIEESVEAR